MCCPTLLAFTDRFLIVVSESPHLEVPHKPVPQRDAVLEGILIATLSEVSSKSTFHLKLTCAHAPPVTTARILFITLKFVL